MKSIVRAAQVVVLVSLSVACAAGCKNKQDATRKQWLDSLTACAAPATCTGKMNAADREVAVCAPFDKKTIAAGDVVVVKELNGAHDTIGRVSERNGAAYRVEFPDGFTLDRKEDVIVGRLCR